LAAHGRPSGRRADRTARGVVAADAEDRAGPSTLRGEPRQRPWRPRMPSHPLQPTLRVPAASGRHRTKETSMSLQLGQPAPDFTARTTAGDLRFHAWRDGAWAVLFSHPANFTPVCTTELGEVARLKPAFEARGVKVIGLSVDA